MPHIEVSEDEFGIRSLFGFAPDSAAVLGRLAQHLLVDDSPLSQADRELIAARVSRGNDCHYCSNSHGAFAAGRIGEQGWDVVEAVWENPATAPVTPRLRALLDIADAVRVSGRNVTTELVEAARRVGATDRELHDTVLIAAAFCMFNRYVDGLGTRSHDDRDAFDDGAKMILAFGYERPDSS